MAFEEATTWIPVEPGVDVTIRLLNVASPLFKLAKLRTKQ